MVEKDEDPKGTEAGKNFMLKELSEVSHQVESSIIQKIDPNFERSMTICQGIGKIPTPAEKLHNEEVSTV